MSLNPDDLGPALAFWPDLTGAVPRLINHSENHIYMLENASGQSFVLRVHRPGYQSAAEIDSELAWLAALREDTDLPVPQPVAGTNGHVLQHFPTPGGQRSAVLFRFIDGVEPAFGDNLTGLFETLGRYAARLHRHVEAWQPPPGFQRQSWTAATILDRSGAWGDWRTAPGVDAGIGAVLRRLDTELRLRLVRYGTGPDRYNLIHADMRLGNLLVAGDRVSLIDFDDCGFCWFTYDFAAAISFHEMHTAVPAMKEAWLYGYRAERDLSAADEASIDTMVMLRRMALLAWIGSHGETALARTHAAGFAEGTAHLAERYLNGHLWPAG